MIIKVKTIDGLLLASLEGVTEIQAMDMSLDELPQDFFLGAKSLEILYLKSSWREDGLPAIPPSVRQLFCCNWGRGNSGGGGSSHTPPKPARRPFVPSIPPPVPIDPSLPVRIEHEGKKWDWDPETQKWEKVAIDIDLLPAGLVKFYASEVKISGDLDFSRFAKMEELILNQCEVTRIVAWPPKVRLIYANWNNMESIPGFPASVELVELNHNRLIALPAIAHTRLQTLRVDKNKLTSIPEMPATLEELRAEQNQLTTMPKVTPLGMLRLYVRNNKLAELPEMYHSELEELFCGFNKLSELPILPATLEQLYCHDNRLKNLGLLPVGLSELYCGYNKLTEHPKLPVACTEFNGVGNQFGEARQYVAQTNMLRYQMDSGLVRKKFA
jgi:hypothetical protein